MVTLVAPVPAPNSIMRIGSTALPLAFAISMRFSMALLSIIAKVALK